jgi:hypothetical protein
VTPAEVFARWRARRTEWERLKAQVDGARLCDEVIADLEAMLSAEREAVLTLREAAEASGYSEGHLARLVRSGSIPDLRPPGSRGHIHIRASDLPQRSGKKHTSIADVHGLASSLFGGRED